jgi:hypothetical protein
MSSCVGEIIVERKRLIVKGCNVQLRYEKVTLFSVKEILL